MENIEFDPMVMSTLETLEMPIMNDYDREEMEHLDQMATEDENTVPEPTHIWDIPGFHDVSAWDVNEPNDEYLGINYGQWGTIGIGATFSNKAEAIYAIQRYSIINRVEYATKESEPRFLVLQCRDGESDCPWRIRVTKKKNSAFWEVTKYRGDHICNIDYIMKENVHMTRHFIAKEICDVITERLRLTPNEIKARIFKDFDLEIRYLKAWQARQQALKDVFGEWDDSFQKLPHFMQALVDSNPETFVKWHRTRDEDNGCMIINRVFWAFGPCIAAFTHCRPVMCIDGTHMYGKYNAKLLVAVALDASNHILPVAFAFVESENNSSWNWFMRCIREGVTQRDEICVISDRHKGIINAMQDADWVPPRAYHRVCIRHLQSNFNMKVKNLTLKKKLGHLVHQRQRIKFDHEYKDLLNLLLEK